MKKEECALYAVVHAFVTVTGAVGVWCSLSRGLWGFAGFLFVVVIVWAFLCGYWTARAVR